MLDGGSRCYHTNAIWQAHHVLVAMFGTRLGPVTRYTPATNQAVLRYKVWVPNSQKVRIQMTSRVIGEIAGSVRSKHQRKSIEKELKQYQSIYQESESDKVEQSKVELRQ